MQWPDFQSITFLQHALGASTQAVGGPHTQPVAGKSRLDPSFPFYQRNLSLMENYSSPFLPSSHLLPFSSDVNISHIPGDFDMNSNGFQGLNVDISIPNSNGHEESQNGTFDVSQNEKRLRKKGEKKVRQPRYAFQTRSHVDILDDGYRWRKYGQKAVKNNIHPRSYYRCTYQGCGVKKQIQRLSKDDSIVVTTYEGMHSHPIEKSADNFERILTRMHMYSSY